MRDLERPSTGSVLRRPVEDELFISQARLTSAFEDDHPYAGIVPHHRRAVYADLDDDELRGYFTWRARWRHGPVKRMPNVFARILAAEIVNGAGVGAPDEGLRMLERLRAEGSALDETGMGPNLSVLFDTWLRDYRIVHDLGPETIATQVERGFAHAASTFRSAEDEVLQTGADVADSTELWRAVASVSAYKPEKSPFLRAHADEAASVFAMLFKRLVDYCALHGARSYADAIVGRKTSHFWKPFVGLPYVPPKNPADARVIVTECSYAERKNGRWRMHRGYGDVRASKELGRVVREMDCRMREEWGFKSKLKPRSLPGGLDGWIQEICHTALLRKQEDDARAEAEKRKIDFDFSKLGPIRTDSAAVREALLVDEEKDDPEEALMMSDDRVPPSKGSPRPASHAEGAEDKLFSPEPDSERPSDGMSADDESTVHADKGQWAEGPLGLSDIELEVVSRAFKGEPIDDLCNEAAVMPSVLVDSINEKFFDEIGDSVLDYVDGAVSVVEDYAGDVRDLLGR